MTQSIRNIPVFFFPYKNKIIQSSEYVMFDNLYKEDISIMFCCCRLHLFQPETSALFEHEHNYKSCEIVYDEHFQGCMLNKFSVSIHIKF